MFFCRRERGSRVLSMIDIGANLTDDMYQGTYNGQRCHQADLDDVIRRAQQANVTRIIGMYPSLSDQYRVVWSCLSV